MSKKSKKMNLLDGSDEEDGAGGELKINKDYAERYDNWRRLEELQRLKDKYGDDVDEHDDDSDSTSSEEPVEWTADDEKSFLKTFAALKTKNPKIYNATEKFFNKEDAPSSSKTVKEKEKKDKTKPMYLKDYERKLITEREGQISEDDEDLDAPKPDGYYAEQERLKQELKAVMGEIDDEEDEEDDGLLVKREKTKEEQRKEDDDYYAWLKGRGTPKNVDEDIKALRDHWAKDDIDEDEKFLKDYIVNKKYEVDGDDDGDAEIPTYDDVVSLEEEEAEMEREEHFEHKYNYRYEEPDQEFIKQYPRTIKESMRRGNEKRKEQREAYKERKEREKQEKKEEIKQIRKMKRSEIEEKLMKLKKMAGDEDLPLNLDDLEEDFDPAKFDKRMKEVFSEKYYEKDNLEDEEKPEFSDMSEIDSDGDDNYDDMDITAKPSVKEEEDSDENEGEGHVKEEQVEEEEAQFREKKGGRRRKKRNSKFAALVKKEKPLFDPNEKTFEEYFNEYYALDYEDIVGDTITKFKYRPVPENSFGLSVDEILETDDKRLNAWVSLKKATQYRTDQEEMFDQRAYERKAQNAEKKKKILSALPQKPKADVGDNNEVEVKEEKPMVKKEEVEEDSTPANGETSESGGKKKRRRNKKNKNQETPAVKEEAVAEEAEAPAEEAAPEPSEDEPKQKSARTRKRKHKGGSGEGGKGMKRPEELQNISDERLQAYGLNPKKFVNQFHHQKKRRMGKESA